MSTATQSTDELTVDATDEQIIDRARQMYATDDVDVLDISPDRIDGGAWVRALVWVPLEDEPDAVSGG